MHIIYIIVTVKGLATCNYLYTILKLIKLLGPVLTHIQTHIFMR